ncbi:MAG: glycosyltransferase family 39 protein [Candidatus Daviesbacteria bacterium]|nr:glycosyltransferase family 39 protein [Candidatus Daviesbacteria bacterium]
MKSLITWIKQNKLECLILTTILGVAAFLRFYRLPDYMTFLGDEGRDALIVKDILVNHIIPSIGPPSSVGNIYLGPLYYYMMAVPMGIFWLNPVAATAMVALIGVMAVALIYYLARVWFGVCAAILAASLYALSFVTITYSRSSWNPNPVPFFTLLAILGFYKARQSKNFLWLILTGISLAAAVQMHYLSLILLPIFGLLWVFELKDQVIRQKYSHFIFGTISAITVFILMLMPLILFDFRHNFLNYRGIVSLFTQSDSSVGFNIFTSLGKILPIFNDKLIGRYLGAENIIVTLFISILVIVPLIYGLYKSFRQSKGDNSWSVFALGIWLIVGLFGISLFKLEIYDHYLGFISPVPFLLLGGFVGIFKNKIGLIITIIIIFIVGFLNLQKTTILQPANYQLERTQQISKYIIQEVGNKQFNFALLSENNYDSAYQYFLDLYGNKPRVVPVDITDQLYVVCEDKVCKPVGNAKYEIAGFGWTLIEKEEIVSGVKVFKLVHNPAQKNEKSL